MPRQKGDPGEIGGCGKYVACAVDNRSSEVWIGKVLHLHFPGNELIGAGRNAGCCRSTRRLVRRGRLVTAACVLTLEEEAVQQPKFNFVGVAEDVTHVKADDPGKILNAVGVAIGQARLNRMLDPPSGDSLFENSAQPRWSEVKSGGNGAAVQQVLDNGGHWLGLRRGNLRQHLL